MATVTTKCQNCGAEFQTDYQLIGAVAACINCHQDSVPQIPNGALIPYHEWDLTYKDFKRLVEDLAYRAEMASLLDGWFGYRIVGDRSDTLIVDKSNAAIDALRLHLKIQGDADKQYKLYQTAMSLWR